MINLTSPSLIDSANAGVSMVTTSLNAILLKLNSRRCPNNTFVSAFWRNKSFYQSVFEALKIITLTTRGFCSYLRDRTRADEEARRWVVLVASERLLDLSEH